MENQSVNLSSILQMPDENVISVLNQAGAEQYANKGRSNARFAILTDKNIYVHGKSFLFYSSRPKHYRPLNPDSNNMYVAPINAIANLQYGRVWRNSNFWRVALLIGWILVGVIFIIVCAMYSPKLLAALEIIFTLIFMIGVPVGINFAESFSHLGVVTTLDSREIGISTKGMKREDVAEFCKALNEARKASV